MEHTSLPLWMKFCRASVAVDPDVSGVGQCCLSISSLLLNASFLSFQ
jgi:hypothetical protein